MSSVHNMAYCAFVYSDIRALASNHISYILREFVTNFLWRCCPSRAMASSFLRFIDHTQRRITFGRVSPVPSSTHRRDLWLTTHNTRRSRHPCPRGDTNLPSHQASGHCAATVTGHVLLIMFQNLLRNTKSSLRRLKFSRR
jgi:hypothetical protein